MDVFHTAFILLKRPQTFHFAVQGGKHLIYNSHWSLTLSHKGCATQGEYYLQKHKQLLLDTHHGSRISRKSISECEMM